MAQAVSSPARALPHNTQTEQSQHSVGSIDSPRQNEAMNQVESLYRESGQEQQEVGPQLEIGLQHGSIQETRQETKLKAHPSTR